MLKFAVAGTGVMAIIWSASMLMGVASFLAYYLSGHTLSAGVIFPSLYLFEVGCVVRPGWGRVCSVVCVLRCDPAYPRAVVVVFVGHFFWGKGCVGCASLNGTQVPVLPVVGSASPYSLHALVTLTTLPPMSLL